jgi:hypothetical protein
MRSEDLIALAAAHGVDLIEAARLAPSDKVKRDVIKQRFAEGRTAMVLQEPSTKMAKGKESPTFVRPKWTVAEIGQAAAGVPPIHFSAACYAFAGDRSQYWPLYNNLCGEVHRLQARFHWPIEIRDFHQIERPYLKYLAKMVLDEEDSQNLFKIADSRLYSIYIGVSEKTWKNEVSERYETLKLVWLGWLQRAARIIQPRLRTQEEAPP